MTAPLAAEQVSHIRHDLRTFANHILGYSEMLLEIAQEEGLDALAGGLNEIHALGASILETIGTILAPSRTDVTPADFPRLADELRPAIETLEARTGALLQTAQELGRSEEAGDLHKIRTAVHNMRRFLADLCGQQFVGQDSNPVERVTGVESCPTNPDSNPVERVTGVESCPTSPDSNPVERVTGVESCPTSAGNVGHGRILIVDDVENNRDMLQRRLEREGYGVVQATNGREALELIARGGLDLVLLDILMPEVDGYEVLRQVKATASGRDLPIIMISSLDEIQSVVRCIEMGAEDYLPKPFDPVLLKARVGACLEKKRLRDQELDYLRQVSTVITAAGAVEAGKFEPDSLQEVAQRSDALGNLARVFQHMGREVQAREQRLHAQVQQLKIEIDETRKKHQVAEVTDTEYFQELQQRAQQLRRRIRKPSNPP